MATAFSAFRNPAEMARSAFDAALGAAGTRVALNALRRYPKTAVAVGVLAGIGAVLGGALKSKADSKKPSARTKPRRPRSAPAKA